MGKKDNFNKAMFDMFGVGADTAEETPSYEKVDEKTEGGLTDTVIVKEAVAAAVSSSVDNEPAPERTYIGRGTVIEGNIKTRGDVEVMGEFKGDIEAAGKVTLHTSVTGNIKAESLTFVGDKLVGDIHTTGNFILGRNSSMNGNLYAKDVSCSGTINGNIDIAGTLTLDETSVINGDIKTGFMCMTRGAVVRGKIEMNSRD